MLVTVSQALLRTSDWFGSEDVSSDPSQICFCCFDLKTGNFLHCFIVNLENFKVHFTGNTKYLTGLRRMTINLDAPSFFAESSMILRERSSANLASLADRPTEIEVAAPAGALVAPEDLLGISRTLAVPFDASTTGE